MGAGDPERTAGAERSVDLWSRAKAGERSALEELCARYVPRLSRWATGRLPGCARSLHETADLVQQTLLQLLRHVDDFEPRHDGALAAYLRTSLLNNIRQQLRSARTRPEPDTLDPDRQEIAIASPLDEVLAGELFDHYERALGQLRPADREAVILRLELDYSYAEIAQQLAIPTANAARMRVSRATLELAKAMRRR